jgi:hypothetical protein
MRTRVILLVACAATALLTVGIGLQGSGHVGRAASDDQLNRAKALAAAPAIPNGPDAADSDPGLALYGNAITDRARAIVDHIPTATGTHFDWTTWEGGISPEGVERVEESYAVCTWLHAWSATPGDESDASVAATIPDWPAFRLNRVGALLHQIVQDGRSGDTSTVEQYVRVNC